MTLNESTPPAASGVQVRIADVVVAKIAAFYARSVPEVIALRPELPDALIDLATRVVGANRADDGDHLPTDGVTATVGDDGVATITIDVVIRLGAPLLEVAKQIQQVVAAQLAEATDISSIVTVNIVDVADEDDAGEASAGDVSGASAPE